MNRKARRGHARSRRVEWAKVMPQGSYADLGEGDARDLLMEVFRSISGEMIVVNDEVLFDSTMSLIGHGLLNVWFALDGNQVLVRYDLPQPVGGAA